MEEYPEIYREEDSFDIKKYLFLVLRNWWWFAISIFIALSIAYIVNRYSEEIYSNSCTLIIGEEGSQSGSIENVLDELTRLRTRRTKAVVSNEISVLKSYAMARKALEELPDFDITYIVVGRRGIAESRMYTTSPFILIPDTLKNNVVNHRIDVTVLSETKYRLDINDQLRHFRGA